MATTVIASDLLDGLRRIRPASGGPVGIAGSSVVRLATNRSGVSLRVRGYRGMAGSAYLGATTSIDKASGDPLKPYYVGFKGLASIMALAEDAASSKVHIEMLAPDTIGFTFGRTSLTLRGWDEKGASGFTLWPDFETRGEATGWDAAPLRDHLRFVAPSASRDDARPILTGLYVHGVDDKLVVAATDSYRLAVSRTDAAAPPSNFLLPGGVADLLPDGDAHITLHGGALGSEAVSWVSNGVEWVSQAISGEFPNYRGLIPANSPVKMSVERDYVLRVLRRVMAFISAGGTTLANPVILEFSAHEDSGAMVRAAVQDFGTYEEFLPADTSQVRTDLKVGFNAKYLSDGIRSMQQPVIEFGATDAQKPVILQTEARTYLLMPIRVS